MSGRGKEGKGLGKEGAKRHRKILRENIQDITKPAIRKLAERPWLGAPEYGEARAGRNSDFARIWRNAIKSIILSMIVLLRYQTVLCVVLGYLT